MNEFWANYGLGAILIAVLQTVVISLLLEWYKGKLKRMEIVSSLYNELQVKSLGGIFVHLSKLKAIVDKMKSDHKDEKISEKDFINWLSTAKSARNVYSFNKYVFPGSMHDKLDALMVNLNTAGPKTAARIERQGAMSYHWDGIEDVYSIEDHAEYSRLSDEIGGYNFLENYIVIQQAGDEIMNDIVKRYKGLD